MKEQKIQIKMSKSFNPKQIFECGQCFRWNKQVDGSYIGVVRHNVIKVQKEKDIVTITGIGDENLQELVTEYFDLRTDYETIKGKLSNVDSFLEESIRYGEGIRILKQDLWEMIISYIISANNNIPRIKGIIEKISKQYGDCICWNDQKYYTFPSILQLSKATVEELRTLGLGFRDQRVYDTTKLFVDKELTIEELTKEKDTNKIRETLMKLPGVGPKVADCILLFGLHKLEVFPIDVWVRRVMNELYFQEEEQNKVKKEKIEELAKKKYQDLSGIAQQYLFYWRRETA